MLLKIFPCSVPTIKLRLLVFIDIDMRKLIYLHKSKMGIDIAKGYIMIDNKKTIFLSNIIRAIFVFMLLVFVFVKNEQLYLRMMILSFQLLTICYIGENVCKLLNKPVGTKIFHKLFIGIFLLFGACFLVAWSYAFIQNKQYFPLIFTIPFWIFEISIFRKSLLGMKSDSKKAKKKSKFDFRIMIPCFLVISILLSGIICLVIGIKDTYQISKKTENYLTTTCYYKDYEIYDSYDKKVHGRTENHTTYRLIYVYEINGKEYSIKTDYGSGSIPDENSSRKIKYNPDNPGEAVFTGTNANSGLIYYGAFFFLGGMVFVLIFLYAKGVFDNVKIDILGLYIGFVLLIVGIGMIAFQIGEVSSFMEAIKRMGFWTLIPALFIITGGFQIIKCLFAGISKS